VGNEVLLRKDMSKQELLTYVQQVREALPGLTVGYVDAYFQFKEHPELVEVCHVVLVNCYPFWEGCSITEASAYLRLMYNLAKDAAKGKKVIITEPGWPDTGSRNGNAQPSKENAMQYFINVQNWVRHEGVESFYFSSVG